MKRNDTNSLPNTGKKAKANTLNSWIMRMKDPSFAEEHAAVAVEVGDSKNMFRLILKPDVFDESIPFAINGPDEMFYVAPGTEMFNTCLQLVADQSPSFQHNHTSYTTFKENDRLYQMNMDTRTRREIIPTPIRKGLDLWFANTNKERAINIALHFPDDFPQSPPFCYVEEPRIRQNSGHIAMGGAFCTELLTIGTGNGTWNSCIQPEDLVKHLITGLMNDGELNGKFSALKIDMKCKIPYSYQEAKVAYERACNGHGWNPAN